MPAKPTTSGAKLPTGSSTPRLSEYAKRFTFPAGIARTVWPRVEARGVEVGLGFDWWQSQLGTVCLGYGADGRYVATVGGIGLSIPRQVGKTYFVMATLVVMCMLFPGLQVVWTSHHMRTTTKTLTTMRGFCRRKKVAPHVVAVRTSHGEGQVEFVNGSMIMFGARSQGFGRGFDAIDVEVFDEAQILDTKALEDMIAATNQARHEHGALLFYMGTPPRPTDPAEAFKQRRDEAWAGGGDDAIWLEIGADPMSHPSDETQWPLMNPSYPLRTPREAMLRLRKNLKDDESWNREGRGIWDDEDATVIPNWSMLVNPGSSIVSHLSIALEVAPQRRWSCFGAAGRRDDGLFHVEVTGSVDVDGAVVLDHRRGTDWVVARGAELSAAQGVPIRIEKGSDAAAFVTLLREAGADVEEIPAGAHAMATGLLLNACENDELRHTGQQALVTAVKAAALRSSGESEKWQRRHSKSADITPLVAVTLALGGVPAQEARRVFAY